jgi:hypothetical protein
MGLTCFLFRVLLSFQVAVRLSLAQDIVSDLVVSSSDENKALQVKAEEFWGLFLTAAHDAHMEEHMRLYTDVERLLAKLPKQNTYVHDALADALAHLKSGDAQVLAQATQSSELATERLAAGPAAPEGGWFFSAGQNFFAGALRRFADGGRYSEQLLEQVSLHQAEILPLLRGTAAATGSVLSNCRLASKRSFDLLKYDIYNKGVPKTPEPAKDLAYRLIDAAGETRHHFTSFVTQAALAIAHDVQGRHDGAAATLARSAFIGAEASTTEPAPRPSRVLPSSQLLSVV